MGNVYMRADQISYKDGTVKDALDNGGGGGTSDYAQLTNKPKINDVTLTGEKSSSDLGLASASDVSGIQELIPSDATSSNKLATASDVSGIQELIPSDATSSNKLATADDLPGLATTLAPGLVQPDGTTVTINNGVISATGGGGGGIIPTLISTFSYDTSSWISDSEIAEHQSHTPSASEITALNNSHLVLMELINNASSYTSVLCSLLINIDELKNITGNDVRTSTYAGGISDGIFLLGTIFYKSGGVNTWNTYLTKKKSVLNNTLTVNYFKIA